MSDPRKDPIASAIRDAGRRPPVAGDDDLDRLSAPALVAWEQVVARRRARRRSRRLAVAAMLGIAVLIGLWRLLVPSAVGTVAIYVGPDVDRYPVGSILASGTRLATANDEWLNITTPSGHQLRLAADTELELLAADRIALSRGAVYVDAAPPPLTVEVAGTVAEHLGTRYLVRLDADGRAEVRVREGRVQLRGPAGTVDFGRGRAATWSLGEPARLVEASPHGDAWAWTLEAAPPFDADGATLADFLGWLEAEGGWAIDVDTDLLVDASGEPIRIVGSIRGLTLEQAARFVLDGAGLSGRHIEDRLVIDSAATSPIQLDAPPPAPSETELGG